jgi:sugar O-acyltransferase (sialic acid O-acetyltransferase NeuD family)
MKRPLVLIGGGGHCKSVIEAAESAGYSILGILDMPESVGCSILDYRVIGTDDDIPSFAHKADFVITVGFITTPKVRTNIYNRVKAAGGRFATVIASSASVSRNAVVGDGAVVLHHAAVNAGASVGDNCIINTAAVIEHDVVIGAQSHISTGAVVNGGCRIGERVFVGSRSVVGNGLSITDDCIVGSGSNVTRNIATPGIYWGNPAKYQKMNVNKVKIGGVK